MFVFELEQVAVEVLRILGIISCYLDARKLLSWSMCSSGLLFTTYQVYIPNYLEVLKRFIKSFTNDLL